MSRPMTVGEVLAALDNANLNDTLLTITVGQDSEAIIDVEVTADNVVFLYTTGPEDPEDPS